MTYVPVTSDILTAMESFSFHSADDNPAPAQLSKFSGKQFYNTYKNSEFLQLKNNIDNILANSFELKNKWKQLKPGETMEVKELKIRGKLLVIKNDRNQAAIGELEFTFYRLCGLIAAYVFENRDRFPEINSSEANKLGLKWDNTDEKLCRLYLSAVSGSQDFYDQFLFYPMICSLRKLHLQKTTPKFVKIIGNIKNDNGKTMLELIQDNNDEVLSLWSLFPTASSTELTTVAMKSFSFHSNDNSSAPAQPSKFSGRQFYNAYKNSEFLHNKANLDNILANSYKLKKQLMELEPGATLKIEEFKIRGKPLILKNTGTNIVEGELEFTFYRLCGFVAAYVFENRYRFPEINSSEANKLGLKWKNTDEEKCRLYLSAVAGSQDHCDQFSFWPLICSLRKLQLKKTKLKSVIYNAKIKNDDGKTMGELFMDEKDKVEYLWALFPNASIDDLKTLKKHIPG